MKNLKDQRDDESLEIPEMTKEGETIEERGLERKLKLSQTSLAPGTQTSTGKSLQSSSHLHQYGHGHEDYIC